MHQLVINGVKLVLIILIPLPLRFPCGEAAPVIGVLLKGTHLRDSVCPALKLNLRRCKKLFIFLSQVVFPLHFGNDLGRKGFQRDFGVYEHQIAELAGKVLSVRALKHCRRPVLHILLKLGIRFVEKFDFFVVKSVAGVDGVPYIGKGAHGVKMTGQLILFNKGLPCALIVGGTLQPLCKACQLSLQRLCIGARVRHFGKFHSFYPPDYLINAKNMITMIPSAMRYQPNASKL